MEIISNNSSLSERGRQIRDLGLTLVARTPERAIDVCSLFGELIALAFNVKKELWLRQKWPTGQGGLADRLRS